jgi:hypothetical protein
MNLAPETLPRQCRHSKLGREDKKRLRIMNQSRYGGAVDSRDENSLADPGIAFRYSERMPPYVPCFRGIRGRYPASRIPAKFIAMMPFSRGPSRLSFALRKDRSQSPASGSSLFRLFLQVQTSACRFSFGASRFLRFCPRPFRIFGFCLYFEKYFGVVAWFNLLVS